MHDRTYSRYLSVIPLTFMLAPLTTWASYTVIDDDLYPTRAIEARPVRSVVSAVGSERFRLGFVRGSTSLGPLGKAFVEGLLPKMGAGTQIKIVAKPDGAGGGDKAAKSKQAGLAQARAASVQAYLVGQGISADSIKVEVDTQEQSGNTVSVAEIIISTPAAAVVSVAPAQPEFDARGEMARPRAIPHQYANLPPPMQMVSSVATQRQPWPKQDLNPPNAGSLSNEEFFFDFLVEDKTISGTVRRWAAAQGFELIWDLPPELDPRVARPMTWQKPLTFGKAIQQIALQLKARGFPIGVHIYPDGVIVFSNDAGPANSSI